MAFGDPFSVILRRCIVAYLDTCALPLVFNFDKFLLLALLCIDEVDHDTQSTDNKNHLEEVASLLLLDFTMDIDCVLLLARRVYV